MSEYSKAYKKAESKLKIKLNNLIGENIYTLSDGQEFYGHEAAIGAQIYLDAQAELEEVRKECEWIPCSERLPEDSEVDYLIHTLSDMIWTAEWYEDDKEFYVTGVSYFHPNDTTHWKPITPPNK